MSGARKTQQTSARCSYTLITFCLIMQPFKKVAITVSHREMCYKSKFIVIVCQHYNKSAFIAHFSSGRKKSLQTKRAINVFVEKQPFTIETVINQIKYIFNLCKIKKKIDFIVKDLIPSTMHL